MVVVVNTPEIFGRSGNVDRHDIYCNFQRYSKREAQ